MLKSCIDENTSYIFESDKIYLNSQTCFNNLSILRVYLKYMKSVIFRYLSVLLFKRGDIAVDETVNYEFHLTIDKYSIERVLSRSCLSIKECATICNYHDVSNRSSKCKIQNHMFSGWMISLLQHLFIFT